MKTLMTFPYRKLLLLSSACLLFSFSQAQKNNSSGSNDYASSGVHIWRTQEIAPETKSDFKLSSVVPVLEGEASDSKIVINWSADADAGSTYFEVERSFDKNSFATVGLVLGGIEKNTGDIVFKYKDISTSIKGKQAAYYRVKQIGSDGLVTYSKVLAVILRS